MHSLESTNLILSFRQGFVHFYCRLSHDFLKFHSKQRSRTLTLQHLIFMGCDYLSELLSEAGVNSSERNVFKHLFSVSGTSRTIKIAAVGAVIFTPVYIEHLLSNTAGCGGK